MNVPKDDEDATSNRSKNEFSEATRKDTILYHLQEMFASQIEPDVVKLTLEDCNFNVNAAIENLLFAAGSDNDTVTTDVRAIKRQSSSPAGATAGTDAVFKNLQTATDTAILTNKQAEVEYDEQNDISPVTDSKKSAAQQVLTEEDDPTKYLVEYRDKRETNGRTSFYGNRISTIYKSNEGLYTEDVTNGDELSQQPVVISTAAATDKEDRNNLTCIRGYRDIQVEREDIPVSSIRPWTFPEPAPPSSSSSVHRPSSSRSYANYQGFKTSFEQSSESHSTRYPRRRRRNWETTSPIYSYESRDGFFSPDSEKSVEADASESFGSFPRLTTATDRRTMNSAVAHKPRSRQQPVSDANGRNHHHSMSTTDRSHPRPGPRTFKQQAISRIKKGVKVLILLRGLPGSGKSTLARELQNRGVVLSADDYFLRNGCYEYDPAKLSEAHSSARRMARQAMQDSRSPVIIDNTNLEVWEMRPYVSEAIKFKYEIHILEPETPWRYDPKMLGQKNSHNVGLSKIARMLERFDFKVSVERLVRECNRISGNQAQGRPSNVPLQPVNAIQQNSKVASRRRPPGDLASAGSISRSLSTKSSKGPNVRLNSKATNFGNKPDTSKNLSRTRSVPNLCEDALYALAIAGRTEEDLMTFDDMSEAQRWTASSRDWDDVAPDEIMVQQETCCNSISPEDEINLIELESGTLTFDKQPSPHQFNLPQDQKSRPRGKGHRIAAALKGLNLKQDWEMPKYPSSPGENRDQRSSVGQYQTMATTETPLSHGLLPTPGDNNDSVFELESAVGSIADLKSYFPLVPVEQLQDIYDKCQGNLHWILDLLLESGYDISKGVLSANPLQCSGSSIEGMAEVSSEGSITGSVLTDVGMMDSSDIPCELPFSKKTSAATVQRGSAASEDLGTPLSSEGGDSTNMMKSQETLVMHLDPTFAMQLQKMFGPANFHLSPVSYYGNDLNVTITQDVARSIYKCWTDTLMSNFKSEDDEFEKMIALDEIYARRLQEEEDAKLAAVIDSDPLGDHFPPLKANDYDYLFLIKTENLPSKTQDLSSRIKRRQLYEMFPKIDKKALDEIFEANDGSLADTIKTVEHAYCPDEQPKVVIAPEQLEEYERAMIEFAEQQSLISGDVLKELPQEEVKKKDKDEDSTEEELNYTSLRAKACLHYQLRKECFAKAKEAFDKKLLAAASYYAQQGHMHSAKFREANKCAKEAILKLNSQTSKSNTLDLHMLHVQEAIDTLNNFLETKKSEMTRKAINQMTLYIITGRGAHSTLGVPKIRPSVIEHLTKHGYSFSEASAGHVEVLLTKSIKK